MKEGTEFVVVSTTVDSEAAARELAERIVREKLAACVQHTHIQSTYRWKGAVESASEYLVLAKTRASLADRLVDFIRTAHTYDVPEIIVTPITGGFEGYLDWIVSETSRRRPPEADTDQGGQKEGEDVKNEAQGGARPLEFTRAGGCRVEKKRFRFRIVIPAYPAFNIYSGIAKRTTALGPVCIASIVNRMEGWDVEIIDENNYRRHGPRDNTGSPDHDALQKYRPADVVGFYGGLTSTAPRLYELASTYKNYGVTAIAGGQHFVDENVNEALLNDINFVVIGEGEETIKDLLPAIRYNRDASSIPGIAFLKEGKPFQTPAREPLTDFAGLPLPDFSLVRYARIKIFPVGWVRGCGMNCEFCTVKGKVRCPGPEYVFEQITALVEKLNARYFFVVDDLFGQDRNATLRLCRMLKDYQESTGVRLDITVQIRLDKAKDTELLQAMRGARISTVAIGIESPISEELTAMNKKIKPDEMISMSRIFHRAGFLVHGMFIFGYPLQEGVNFRMSAKERIRRYRSFVRKARIDTIQVLLPVPLPGTALTERLHKEHRIYPKDCLGWEYYDGNFPLFEPDEPLTPEKIQACLRKIMGRFYRFKYLFAIGLNILSFPAMIFFIHNIRVGWRKWYREWRNNILRFSGWVILKNWTSEFKRGVFSMKLQKAKEMLARQKK